MKKFKVIIQESLNSVDPCKGCYFEGKPDCTFNGLDFHMLCHMENVIFIECEEIE